MSFYNVSVTARLAAQASPSVSIERGTHRMRAPAKERPSRLGPQRKSQQSSYSMEKRMALLVVALLLAALSCFSFAYYLFTTRWDSTTSTSSGDHAEAVSLPANLDVHDVSSPSLSSPRIALGPAVDCSLVFSTVCLESDLHVLDGERYLAYLPHSGFHNQRIALENALVLARILNRTLLVPPIRLSAQPLPYKPFEELRETLVNDTRMDSRYCAYVEVENAPECVGYAPYTYLPWDWLVDLTPLRQKQRMVSRWNFTDDWLEEHLHVTSANVYILRDANRTDYSWQDFKSTTASTRKYTFPQHLSTLQSRPEMLLHLGTLFGSSRLHLRRDSNTHIRREVRQSMAFANPALMRAADSIQNELGGTYLAAHVRLGDGWFAENGDDNVRLIWWKLLLAVGLQDADILALERSLYSGNASTSTAPHIKPDLPSMRMPHPPLPPLPLHPKPVSARLRSRCAIPPGTKAQRLNPLAYTPLFIATDAPVPSTHPLLARFLATFPCTFFLSDFPDSVASLGALYSPYDDTPLGNYMKPFLEAMVAGRAWTVVGTPGSTFSTFVGDVLWRTYHGFEIVQRG